jgi:molybdate transport system substrate-binding protein
MQNKKNICCRLLVILCAITCLAACRPATRHDELLVSSAVSLKDVMIDIAAQFEKAHPGTKVVFNFGSSGQLAQQVMQGAPADVFISAAAGQVDELAQKGLLVAGSIHDCAGNRLVVLSAGGRQLLSLGDLSDVHRLAIGNPKTVPCGEYARRALVGEKLYDSLSGSGKLVLAENARQILAYVEGGDVDAGIAYNTDAMLAQKSKVCFAIPESLTGPMFYKIAVVNRSSHRELAFQFLEFVRGLKAKKSFQQRGFSS